MITIFYRCPGGCSTFSATISDNDPTNFRAVLHECAVCSRTMLKVDEQAAIKPSKSSPVSNRQDF